MKLKSAIPGTRSEWEGGKANPRMQDAIWCLSGWVSRDVIPRERTQNRISQNKILGRKAGFIHERAPSPYPSFASKASIPLPSLSIRVGT